MSTNLQIRDNVLYNFTYQDLIDDRLELFTDEKGDVLEAFASDVLTGLESGQKYLLPKYFYDNEGSLLFDKITATPEYYLKRIEKDLLNSVVNDLLDRIKGIKALVELGSGTSEKTHVLLRNLHTPWRSIRYVPVDVSDIIIKSSKSLIAEYDTLSITGIIADYESGLSVLPYLEEKFKLLMFLGSSIGNLNRSERHLLLGKINDALDPGDHVLIGFDLVKDSHVLQAAYNDRAGITRNFNMNLLKRINRELGGEFDLDLFEHHAFFNETASRIEMHLISTREQTVRIGKLNREFSFSAGESIHTENSFKFTDQMIQDLIRTTGFSHVRTWKDPQEYFALTLIRVH